MLLYLCQWQFSNGNSGLFICIPTSSQPSNTQHCLPAHYILQCAAVHLPLDPSLHNSFPAAATHCLNQSFKSMQEIHLSLTPGLAFPMQKPSLLSLDKQWEMSGHSARQHWGFSFPHPPCECNSKPHTHLQSLLINSDHITRGRDNSISTGEFICV